jgi:hypothetical protein
MYLSINRYDIDRGTNRRKNYDSGGCGGWRAEFRKTVWPLSTMNPKLILSTHSSSLFLALLITFLSLFLRIQFLVVCLQGWRLAMKRLRVLVLILGLISYKNRLILLTIILLSNLRLLLVHQ